MIDYDLISKHKNKIENELSKSNIIDYNKKQTTISSYKECYEKPIVITNLSIRWDYNLYEKNIIQFYGKEKYFYLSFKIDSDIEDYLDELIKYRFNIKNIFYIHHPIARNTYFELEDIFLEKDRYSYILGLKLREEHP